MPFEAHYSPTTVDPPEVVRFIRQQYPGVQFKRPPRSMWAAILANHWPPTRQIRYCCQEFKERGGRGRRVVTGIRWEESSRRRNRHMVETCYRDATTTFVNPIIDWTEVDVWEFLGQRPHCSLYDEGFTRIGCVLCPMSRDARRDIARWPAIAAKYVQTFDKVIVQRREQGKACSFATGAEMFAWWTNRDRSGEREGQGVLFD